MQEMNKLFSGLHTVKQRDKTSPDKEYGFRFGIMNRTNTHREVVSVFSSTLPLSE